MIQGQIGHSPQDESQQASKNTLKMATGDTLRMASEAVAALGEYR